MKIGYFPGCSLKGTSKEFDLSVWRVLEALDVQLEDVNNWNCCGATSAHATSHILSLALPVRNLLLAKAQGFEEIVSPCAACYSRLINAQHEMSINAATRKKVEFVLEKEYSNGTVINNIIQIFYKIGLDKIKSRVTKKIEDARVACYYGCLLVRPNNITHFDDPEQPTTMETIVDALGIPTVDWQYKVECCGAAHSIAHTSIVEKLSKTIIDNAQENGANIIVVACPMCHSNLDMRQTGMKKHFPNHEPIPVLFLSELIGLAIGIAPKGDLDCILLKLMRY